MWPSRSDRPRAAPFSKIWLLIGLEVSVVAHYAIFVILGSFPLPQPVGVDWYGDEPASLWRHFGFDDGPWVIWSCFVFGLTALAGWTAFLDRRNRDRLEPWALASLVLDLAGFSCYVAGTAGFGAAGGAVPKRPSLFELGHALVLLGMAAAVVAIVRILRRRPRRGLTLAFNGFLLPPFWMWAVIYLVTPWPQIRKQLFLERGGLELPSADYAIPFAPPSGDTSLEIWVPPSGFVRLYEDGIVTEGIQRPAQIGDWIEEAAARVRSKRDTSKAIVVSIETSDGVVPVDERSVDVLVRVDRQTQFIGLAPLLGVLGSRREHVKMCFAVRSHDMLGYFGLRGPWGLEEYDVEGAARQPPPVCAFERGMSIEEAIDQLPAPPAHPEYPAVRLALDPELEWEAVIGLVDRLLERDWIGIHLEVIDGRR